jgi:mRNA-degrading endonuclease toxin of MazEF toxin-antitoxin module
MEFKRGQIWSVKFSERGPENIALRVSANQFNERSIIVLPVKELNDATDNTHSGILFNSADTNFEKDILVLCNTIATIPTTCLIDYIGGLRKAGYGKDRDSVKEHA